ncbi:hypothetical protein C2G38_2152713 [Gigaspora rosea]|uniref:Uncharacterized protein n=1 Tax=Gigaspora rosea TaxID=44941 RepID=A0A397W9P0_9GLOM|nr:hypothetical protein C2G38_2152713 [Gigaspora rosea]
MANIIKTMPITDMTLERLEFQKTCISFYNKRWAEFDTDFYLLAYFFHPKYCSKGLVSEAFQKIYQRALIIWKSLDGGNNIVCKKVSNIAKLHAYYVMNACHELNYVGQNLSESDFLQIMQNYTHSLTSDDLEDNPITNKVDSNILEIENSINLNLALNNMDQTLVLDEVIDHGEEDFDVDTLVNQGMQM